MSEIISQPPLDLSALRRSTRQFLEICLRSWTTTGFDPAAGTFLEALDFDGNPLPALDRRGRVQARQIYSCALAHIYGLDPDGAILRVAEHAYRSAAPVYGHPEGGWIFSADPAGEQRDERRLVYEHAFMIMGLSGLARATGNPVYERKLEEAWQWVESLRDREHGGFRKGLPIEANGLRDQNSHMHLFEACLDASNWERGVWLARATELYELAARHYIASDGELLEFFNDDWSPHPVLSVDLQPGHHFEWVWLLTQYHNRSGLPIPSIDNIYAMGLAVGLDSEGLGFDEVKSGGKALRPTKRLWVQCEVLKAHLARYEVTAEAVYLDRAIHVLDRMFARYFIVDRGVWFDQLDENNINISQNAQASTFYHIFVALMEFLRVTA